MSNPTHQKLKAPTSPRYKEFTLPEIQREFSPRKVYDNGDSFIIHPLPQEGHTPFLISKTLPAIKYSQDDPEFHPIDPTIAFQTGDALLAKLVRTSSNISVRFGHLTTLEETGTHHTGTPQFRLDLRDLKTADACQIIVHRCHTFHDKTFFITYPYDAEENITPAHLWRSNQTCPNPTLPGLLDFYRYLISPTEFFEYWLIRYDKDTLSQLRIQFRTKFQSYVDYTANLYSF